MNNGQDPTDTPDDTYLPTVVHVDGWGPGTDARSILGGDDFRESIDLTTPSSRTAPPCSACSAKPPPTAPPASC
ncbi:hypothetical protein ACFQ60_47055 [Streptomyces zhihengii]